MTARQQPPMDDAADDRPSRELDATEEYDVRTAFIALDDDRIGEISFGRMRSLILGLGYSYLTESDFRKLLRSVSEKHRYDPRTPVDVEVALRIVAKCRPRNRTAALDSLFDVIDTHKMGYITVQDVLRLSNEAGEPVSEKEAQLMVHTVSKQGNNCSTDRSSDTVDRTMFRAMMTPKSP